MVQKTLDGEGSRRTEIGDFHGREEVLVVVRERTPHHNVEDMDFIESMNGLKM